MSHAFESSEAPTLGEQMRKERKAQGKTLQTVADACEISVSFLSQIERDQAQPSVATLHRLAEYLGQPLSGFFDGASITDRHQATEDHALIVRRDQRLTVTFPGSGIRNELLTPDLKRAIQFMWVVIPPGEGTGDEPLVHEGEECGVVIQGQVEIWIGEDQHEILGPGDSIYQKSTIPHRSRNISDVDAIIVTAITPPSL